MLTRSIRMWQAVGACALILILAGCQSTPTHDENVNAANARWKSVRSASMLHMAQQQFDAGDLNQAEKTLASAIGIDAGNPYLHIMAGRVALERGQLERSFRRLSVAVELDGQIPEAHYYLGIVMQRWTRYDQALESYQRAYDLEPDNVAYVLAVGETLVAAGQLDEAVELLAGRIVYFDQNAAIRVALAHMHTMRGEHDLAANYLAEAVLLQPDDVQIHEELALAYVAANALDDAIRTLESLCARAELNDRTDLRMQLGAAYHRVGRTEDAREIYLQVTRADPKHTHAWLRLGEIALRNERYAEAMTAAGRARRLTPTLADPYLLQAMVWERRGMGLKALPLLERAEELDTESSAAVLLRGIILQREGRDTEAAEAYAEALRRDPEDSRVQRLLAQVTD